MTIINKKLIHLSAAVLLLASATPKLCAADEQPKVGVVNFRQCLEDSKLGKAERDRFDDLRRKMEATAESKETALQELTSKFNDPDYIDGLSPEAEAKAKEQYRDMTQELAQIQQQYYQILQHANMYIVQKIADQVSEAASEVAEKKSLSLVLNQEGCFYQAKTLDISGDIVEILNKRFESGAVSVSDLEKELQFAG